MSRDEALDQVLITLDTFQGIRDRWLRDVLAVLPVLLLVVGVATVTVFPRLPFTDALMIPEERIMFATGLVAAAVSLVLFQSLMHSVPQALSSLWGQRIISAPSEHLTRIPDRHLRSWIALLILLPLLIGLTTVALRSVEVQPTQRFGIGLALLAVAAGYAVWTHTRPRRPTPLPGRHAAGSVRTETQPDPARDERHYVTFIREFEQDLNSPQQWASGLFFMALVPLWYPFDKARLFEGTELVLISLGFILELVTALVIGLLAWRMVMVGKRVWQLGTRLHLTPRLGHPDRSAGLASVGRLCLVNAFIVSVPGIFLGGWIMIGPVTPYKEIAELFSPLFSWLLIIPIVYAIVSFFVPLWSIHRAMRRERDAVRRQQDQISRRIHELSRQYLFEGETLLPEEREAIDKEIASLQRIYDQYRDVPVWPFNVAILSEFISSQAVPILGITGIGKPIVEVVGSVLEFIWPTT